MPENKIIFFNKSIGNYANNKAFAVARPKYSHFLRCKSLVMNISCKSLVIYLNRKKLLDKVIGCSYIYKLSS